jgi:hypothetical protein
MATPSTPPLRNLQAQLSEEKQALVDALPAMMDHPIRERGGNRRRRRPRSTPEGVSILEKRAPGEELANKRLAEEPMPDREAVKRRYTYRKLAKVKRDGADSDDEAALDQIPMGFGEEFFSTSERAKALSPALCRAAAKPLIPETLASGVPEASATDTDVDFSPWLNCMSRLGFSLLLQGVGSKWNLLERFANEVLVDWGMTVVKINGFDARHNLADSLREVIEQVFPKYAGRTAGSTVDALTTTLGQALCSQELARQLCFVVHNLECLPAAHQAALASLATKPCVRLAVSVDNILAPLLWRSTNLEDFNFFRVEVHTFEGYQREFASRFSKGMPGWCDPESPCRGQSRASVGVVLRSLTDRHRELVTEMAEHQLSAGGRSGLSQSRLLEMAKDLMIAHSASKLRSMLNELVDHNIVVERVGSEGCVLLFLTSETKVLQKLAKGQLPESDDENDEGAFDGY